MMKIKTPWIWLSAAVVAVFFLSMTTLSTLAYFKLRNVKTSLVEVLEGYIDGKIEIKEAEVNFFPAGIDLEGVRLYAPKDKEASVIIPKAKLRFDLLPLLRKKIRSKLLIEDPIVRLHTPKRGPSNMERIFAPVLKSKKNPSAKSLDQMWWKRLAFDRLSIKNAQFISTQSDKKKPSELKNINIFADQIRFESSQKPAKINISYEMPSISKKPLELTTLMRFFEKDQSLRLEKGKFTWGPYEIPIEGKAQLPAPKRPKVNLDFSFTGKALALGNLSKVLKKSPKIKGPLNLKGNIQGSPYRPELSLELDSPELKASGHHLQNFQASIVKKKTPIQIKQASFKIFGGEIKARGDITTQNEPAADLKIQLKSLSVAAMSGKKDQSSRLSGQMKIKIPQLKNPKSAHGGGNISLGPIDLPQMNLEKKIRFAEILAAGTGLQNKVNVGMLSNSANVIGTRVKALKAKVSIAGTTIALKPFSLANGHFQASGNGKIFNQKTLSAGGTFTLKPQVTRQLIPDPLLRKVLTEGRNQISFPFSLNGPLSDPQVSVDSSALKGRVAMATALLLQQQAMQGLDPQKMVKEALKNTPLNDPENPLGQILGAQLQAPEKPKNSPKAPSRKSPAPKRKPQPVTGNALADQLLFGN